MESNLSTVETEYIKNLQQQIYFLEMEASFLRDQTKKATDLQPRLTSEKQHMFNKLQEVHSQCHSLKLEVKRKDANLLMLQRDYDHVKAQIRNSEDIHSKEKQQLVEEIVQQKKLKDLLDLQISQKERDILHNHQELEREMLSLTDMEQRARSLQAQIHQRSEQHKSVEKELSEKRTQLLKVNSAMHEKEEMLLKHTAETQHQIALDLRNEISFLHQQVREKELLSEQDILLRSKMMSDCSTLAAENNALQSKLHELNKQLETHRTLKEDNYSRDSSSIAQLLSVKDKEEQLNREVKQQKELLKLEKDNFKNIMDQLSMLQSGNTLHSYTVASVSSGIDELKVMLAKEERINLELRKDKALLVDHISNLQTQGSDCQARTPY
ncbi:golgin subfamily A member 6-like protein 7 isoform X2 [Xenopus laevis]|uniref:Golgin subfamily A member 6-like protein 7 isoform X2 n=1 Tax=Xenopus laevis TaxID=8355 RepID=A0A8J0VBA9_XENLA|nr:golgin subfamily A member 6-like protein 7 isoform X2 [Xenopus laevis]